MNSLMPLKRMRSHQSKIKRIETESSLTSMIGISMMPRRSGASVQRLLVQISLSIKPRPSNILTKLRIHAKLPSNGPPKKPSWLKKTWEVLDSTLWTLPSTLTLSTEVVVKSSQLPEESSMLLNSLLSQDSSNQSSCAKSKPQMMLWEVSIKPLPKEEVSLLVKSQLPVLHWLSLRLTCQSLNHSVSPNTWEPWPQEEPSHNACSTIGKPSVPTQLKPTQRPLNWLKPSERERVSSQVSQASITSSTSYEQFITSKHMFLLE